MGTINRNMQIQICSVLTYWGWWILSLHFFFNITNELWSSSITCDTCSWTIVDRPSIRQCRALFVHLRNIAFAHQPQSFALRIPCHNVYESIWQHEGFDDYMELLLLSAELLRHSLAASFFLGSPGTALSPGLHVWHIRKKLLELKVSFQLWLLWEAME